MATYTEFYCDPVSGSNLNGGSDAGASPSMSDTAGTGSWVSSTNVYTSVATTGSVAVGQFMAIYQTGATAPAWVARITAVSGGGGSAWVITLNGTGAGAKPTTGSTYFAKVGGAWAGPTGTVGFPFTIATLTSLTDASGHATRVNFKNNATYSITANISSSSFSGQGVFQGYGSSVGDGGKATFDGGTSGASFTLLTANCSNAQFVDLVFQNNGSTGTATGVIQSGSSNFWLRCVFSHLRGYGVFAANNFAGFQECEAFDCNQSNSSTPLGGFNTNVSGVFFRRCISHDHAAGANCHGFIILSTAVLEGCIASGCAGHGVYANTGYFARIEDSTFYNNTKSGIALVTSPMAGVIENCIFDSNGAYGIQATAGAVYGYNIRNCAFYNNTSGQIDTNASSSPITGSITLTSSALNAPSSGDFTLNSTAGGGASCLNAGIGSFTQTAAGFSGTTSYPDVGAAQANATSPPPPAANPLSLILTAPTVY